MRAGCIPGVGSTRLDRHGETATGGIPLFAVEDLSETPSP